MNNTALLTAGNAVYAQKRARKRGRLEELTFDSESRKDFLTGFHKRKAQRQKKAADYVKEQARKERIETRKEIRDARKADIQKRLQAVNDHLQVSDEEEWEGITAADIEVAKDSIWQDHFEDNEKTTTVTVIEDFDQNDLTFPDGNIKPSTPEIVNGLGTEAIPQKTDKPPQGKKKKKAFRYGTKAERQADRRKAKLKKHNHNKSQKRK